MDRLSLPALFESSDRTSLDGQRLYFRLTTGSLGLLVLAAVMSALDYHVAAIVAACAFLIAIIVRIALVALKPDRSWYEGRAAAESSKSLAWRYAVKGAPFSGSERDDALFAQRIRDTLTDLSQISLAPTTAPSQITESMRQMRSLDLAERRVAYSQGRIADQRDWYSRRARFHQQRGCILFFATLVVEAVGGLAAILRAVSVVDVDLFGMAAAITAAVVAWEQASQDTTIARAYVVAAQELASIADLIPAQTSEQQWTQFVDEAEEAISREHRLWRASRAV